MSETDRYNMRVCGIVEESCLFTLLIFSTSKLLGNELGQIDQAQQLSFNSGAAAGRTCPIIQEIFETARRVIAVPILFTANTTSNQPWS